MALADDSLRGVRCAYPDRMARGIASFPEPGPAWGLLAALFLTCLTPRLLMAWRLGAVCDDAYYYVFVANALNHGDLTTAFDYLNLNIYPALLVGLQKLGLEWVAAGKLWGALISSLLVLPMFGWVRRLFDDRVAATACFLYAVHPHLIEVSVEPIREATFWFLFTLCLYLFWRALAGLRFRWFALAGIALALALHTRVESWALFIPLSLWAFFRWRMLAGDGARLRWKLAAGTLGCVAVTPLLLLLVNVTFLSDHGRWEFGRLNHFALVGSWLKLGELQQPEEPAATDPAGGVTLRKTVARSVSELAGVSGPNDFEAVRVKAAVAPPPPPVNVPPVRPEPAYRSWLWMYVKDLGRSLGPVSIVFTIAGLWNWWPLARHRDKSVLVVVCLALLLAIWIRLTQIGNINGRYFLALTFVLAPFQALGCLDVLTRVGWFANSPAWRKVPRMVPAIGLLTLLLAAGWTDALNAHHREREAHAAFGRSLKLPGKPRELVVADLGSTRAGYYVNESLPIIIAPEELFDDAFDRHPPDVIVFSRECLPVDRQPRIEQRAAELGLQLVDATRLPHTEAEFIVLMREPPAGRITGYAPANGSSDRIARQ